MGALEFVAALINRVVFEADCRFAEWICTAAESVMRRSR